MKLAKSVERLKPCEADLSLVGMEWAQAQLGGNGRYLIVSEEENLRVVQCILEEHPRIRAKITGLPRWSWILYDEDGRAIYTEGA